MKEAGDFTALLQHVAAGRTLGADEAAQAFAAMIAGDVTQTHMAAFLTALAMRGATIDEITGGARALRAQMVAVTAPGNAIDVCGTGGDGQGTLNVSTAVGLVVAGCGVPVAKHGNRAMSSRTGSADVLEALGVRIVLQAGGAEECLRAANICFMFAQVHHPAMKRVAEVRRQLGFRTVFNLLGPLANPAQVKRQLVGVYDEAWVEPVCRTLHALGSEKVWVVHGGGIDELTLSGTTKVAALTHDEIKIFEVTPEDAGLARADVAALKGSTKEANAEAIKALLRGEKSAFRDIVLLNAAAALVIADKAADLKQGAKLAAAAIDEGAAQAALDTLVAASHEVAA